MSPQRVTLTSPSDLLAVVPHLLGFHPTDSLVVIALHDRRVGLMQRLDLPAPADTGKAAHTVARHLLGQDPDAAVLVGYETNTGASTPVLDAVAELLAPTGVAVHDSLVVRDGRWRSLNCVEACCPEYGTPLPTPKDSAGVISEFIGRGSAPLPSRADLANQLEPNSPSAGRHEAVPNPPGVPQLHTVESPGTDVLINAWASVLEVDDPTSPPSHQDAAVALMSLRDVNVRDGLIGFLSPGTLPVDELPADTQDLIANLAHRLDPHITSPDAARDLRHRLTLLAGSAPDEHAAPILTVLAAHAWAGGDGALARVALHRALRCEPGYRLAGLLTLMVEENITLTDR